MSNLHLTGWPISCLKSPYLRRPLKTRRDLRETSGCFPEQDLTVGSSLNHNSTETGKNNSLSGHGPG